MLNGYQLFYAQIKRELILGLRQPQVFIYSSLFFLMVVIFFPLTLPLHAEVLRELAPGIIWVTFLFAIFLSTYNIFKQDDDFGIIEQWLLTPYSLSLIVLAKALIYWMLILGPVLIFSPLLALLFHFSGTELGILVLSLILGTPTLVFVAVLVAVFNRGGQKGLLMTLILFPLCLPILIFASACLNTLTIGIAASLGYLAILLALSLSAVSFLPGAIASIMRAIFIE